MLYDSNYSPSLELEREVEAAKNWTIRDCADHVQFNSVGCMEMVDAEDLFEEERINRPMLEAIKRAYKLWSKWELCLLKWERQYMPMSD